MEGFRTVWRDASIPVRVAVQAEEKGEPPVISKSMYLEADGMCGKTTATVAVAGEPLFVLIYLSLGLGLPVKGRTEGATTYTWFPDHWEGVKSLGMAAPHWNLVVWTFVFVVWYADRLVVSGEDEGACLVCGVAVRHVDVFLICSLVTGLVISFRSASRPF